MTKRRDYKPVMHAPGCVHLEQGKQTETPQLLTIPYSRPRKVGHGPYLDKTAQSLPDLHGDHKHVTRGARTGRRYAR